ncbi:MAG: hypothetical protein LBH00_12230 [Planctomycetaceae bacterium]|jgi:hypothetical protein|nr:hypothetical protein [Planctomycetaceae bacterium]
MANFFYFDSTGTKQGPVTSAQLKVLTQQGIITPDTRLETDTGHTGQAKQIQGLFPPPEPSPFEPILPPSFPQPPYQQHYAVPLPLSPAAEAIKKLNMYFTALWISLAAALPFYLISILFDIGFLIARGRNPGFTRENMNPDVAPMFVFVWALMTLAFTGVAVSGCLLLYSLWKQVPPDIARTTPGKAVGFAFIPVFNLYWVFVVVYGLTQDMNTTLERAGLPKMCHEQLGFITAWATCVASVCDYFSSADYFGFFVVIAAIMQIGSCAISIVYVKNVKDAAIALLQRQQSS